MKLLLSHSDNKIYSKILTTLGIENTATAAHQLLLDINYWQVDFNPYPVRHKYHNIKQIPYYYQQIDRQDLTHLNAYAIDNIDSLDADDALSIDDDWCWIHIADVCAFVTPDSSLDNQLNAIGSNLYLPEKTLTMLPDEMIEKISLKAERLNNVVSIKFKLVDGEINNITICYSKIYVQNLSYQQAEENLTQQTDLIRLNALAKTHYRWRKSQGAIQLDLPKTVIKYNNRQVIFTQEIINQARKMVAEWMIIAGRAVAKFSQQNKISLPFLLQAQSEISINDITAELSLSQKFTLLRKMQRSKVNIKPNKHGGLGLESYVRFTSPMRRYLDLLAHQQIYLFLNKQPLLSDNNLKKKIKIVNAVMPKLNKISRDSQQHYRCLYFMKKQNWQGSATVINYHKQIATLHITNANITTQVITEKPLKRDVVITIYLIKVDLPNLILEFGIKT